MKNKRKFRYRKKGKYVDGRNRIIIEMKYKNSITTLNLPKPEEMWMKLTPLCRKCFKNKRIEGKRYCSNCENLVHHKIKDRTVLEKDNRKKGRFKDLKNSELRKPQVNEIMLFLDEAKNNLSSEKDKKEYDNYLKEIDELKEKIKNHIELKGGIEK